MNQSSHFTLYAYTYPDALIAAKAEGRLKVKVGDTIQGMDLGLSPAECAQLRIDQQGNANESQKKILLGAWFIKRTGHFKRDYDLAKLLKSAGKRPTDLSGKGMEWYYFDFDASVGEQSSLDDLMGYIKRLTGDSPRKPLRLRKIQEDRLQKAIEIVKTWKARGVSDKGCCSIIAYLCPRFGKTVWALELFRRCHELFGQDVMLLPAFVLSAHTSFRNEIGEYTEFTNMEFIDTQELDDPKAAFDEAQAAGKLVVISISMHTRNLEQFLFIQDLDNGRKFEFVDEADLGAWTDKKIPVANYMFNDRASTGAPIRIIASGTNIQRMALGLHGRRPDGLIQVAYCEMEKTEPGMVKRKFYQMELSSKDVKFAIENDGNFSWGRFFANIDAHAPHARSMIGSMFGVNDDVQALSLNRVLGKDPEVVMFFCNGTNAELGSFHAIVTKILNRYIVIRLGGDAENEQQTTNKSAESIVKAAIVDAKRQNLDGVVIITNTMGNRSFSIPEVEASVMLCDRGAVSTFTQRALRTGTPGDLYNGKHKTHGAIISLSVDQNRHDQVYEVLLDEARVVMANNPGLTLPEALRDWVFDSVNIFRKNPKDGVSTYLKLELKDVMEDLQTSQNVLKVADATVDIASVLEDQRLLMLLSSVKVTDEKGKEVENTILKKAKTFAKDKTKITKPTTEEKKELKELVKTINAALRTLNGTATSVLFLSGLEEGGYRDALVMIDSDAKLNAEFSSLYGIEASVAIDLLDAEILKGSLLDIVVYNTKNDLQDDLTAWN